MEQDIVQAISKLRDTKRELLDKAEKIETAISYLEELFGDRQLVIPQTVPAVSEPQIAVLNGPYSQMTIRDAAIKYLKSVGTPKKTAEIVAALRGGGAISTNLYRAIYNSLRSSGSAALTDDKKWKIVFPETNE